MIAPAHTYTPAALRRISGSFVGRHLGIRRCLVYGGVMGLCIGYVYYFDIVLIFFPPAWVLLAVGRLYPLLRRPRSNEWQLICGLEYAALRAAVYHFVKQHITALCVIFASMAGIDGIVRLFFVHNPYHDTASYVLCGAGVVSASIMSLYGIMRFRLIAPDGRDREKKLLSWILSNGTSVRMMRLKNRIVTGLVRRVPGACSHLAKRQILYLIQDDFLSSGIFVVSGILFAVLLTLLQAHIGITAAYLGSLGILLFLFSELTALFSESSDAFHRCPYYNGNKRDYFFSNLITVMLLSGIVVFSFMVCAAGTPAASHRALPFPAIVSYVLSYLSITVSFAYRWSFHSWKETSITLLALSVLCSLVGGIGASYHSLFNMLVVPLVPGSLAVWYIVDLK